jgi:hypothetical protein
VEDQFVPSRQQVSRLHDGTVNTAVAIGYDLPDPQRLTGDRIKSEELDTHAGRRASVHGV